MELFYYLHTLEEDHKHTTWAFITTDHIHPMTGALLGSSQEGWTKEKMPSTLTKEEELDWYIQSNREDLHFIMKESEACTEWKMKEMGEIIKAQKENKKLKQYAV